MAFLQHQWVSGSITCKPLKVFFFLAWKLFALAPNLSCCVTIVEKFQTPLSLHQILSVNNMSEHMRLFRTSSFPCKFSVNILVSGLVHSNFCPNLNDELDSIHSENLALNVESFLKSICLVDSQSTHPHSKTGALTACSSFSKGLERISGWSLLPGAALLCEVDARQGDNQEC